MGRIEPIGPLRGRSGEGPLPPVAPIGRRARDEHDEPPPRRQKRRPEEQEHLLDEQA